MINIVGLSPIPKMIRTSGTQAMGDTGRSKFMIGSKATLTFGNNPKINPTKSHRLVQRLIPKNSDKVSL